MHQRHCCPTTHQGSLLEFSALSHSRAHDILHGPLCKFWDQAYLSSMPAANIGSRFPARVLFHLGTGMSSPRSGLSFLTRADDFASEFNAHSQARFLFIMVNAHSRAKISYELQQPGIASSSSLRAVFAFSYLGISASSSVSVLGPKIPSTSSYPFTGTSRT